MSKIQQDSFTDDAEESCPLCVEEFDLSDKNFRPCPCGYQICQFCYNNIKNNMNGLCPACRRPYDDQSIEWKVVSPEEQKADIALQARKKALARKKESEQKQVETNSRKHLAGIRVVQKNLVYVLGLTQQQSEDDFLKTLRGQEYFGQYGRIQKIVVSKPKSATDNAIGIYITFERKEDAAKCISAVDGSRNLDKNLRAQYGTTKYCSAYLRHETCNNRNCTFLHEVGEDHDSFSRQDLSSMNAMSTQRPAHPSSSRSNQASQPQPPAQQNIQSISQALHSIQLSKDDTSRTEPDAPALPSSANWAAKNSHTEAGRSSKPPSMSDSSPVASSSQPEPQTEPPLQPSSQQPAVAPEQPRARPRAPSTPPDLMNILAKKIATADFSWSLDRTMFSEKDLQIIDNFPPLFMMDGGRRRFQALKEQEQERLKQEEERNVIGAVSTAEDDENLGSGSLQLGGEPETQDESADTTRFGPSRSAIQPPANSTNYPFGALPTASVGNLSRTITPQQRDLLQRVNSARQSPVTQGPFQQGYGQTSLHQHQTSNPFQNQAQGPGVFGNQGHARQTSRFTFSNETSHSTIKPAANPQLSAQQAGVLPAAHGKQFQGQFHQSTAPNFYSGVQGPPPGLKSSGTPPISGGGMFGQGHGFASAMGGSAGFGALGKNANDESIQQFLRSRDRGNSGQGPDFGKRPPQGPPQAPRFPGTTTRIDSLARDTTTEPQPSRHPRQGTPTPGQAAPGISSAQDFPSLPTPAKPQTQPASTSKKNVGKTPNVKPVVPKKAIATVSASGQAQTDEKETDTVVKAGKLSKTPTEEPAASFGLKTEHTEGAEPSPKGEVEREKPEPLHLLLLQQGTKAKKIPDHTEPKESEDVTSEPSTPTHVATQQPASTTATSVKKPKTIHVGTKVQEGTSSTHSGSPGGPSSIKEIDRRASTTSLQQPATPSDSASFTTTTLSRANSPPPSRVGTAPARQSKAQQKKERQARAKQVEAEKKTEQQPQQSDEQPAVVQEPIVGRKKKTKKAKQPTTAESTPPASRAPSPDRRQPEANEEMRPLTVPESLKETKKMVAEPISENEATDEPAVQPTTQNADIPTSITPHALMTSLLESGELAQSAKDIFHMVPSIHTRFESTPDLITTLRPPITSEQSEQLNAGKPIMIQDPPSKATSTNANNIRFTIVLPDRKPLPGFTKQQAQRFLELTGKVGGTPSMPRELDSLVRLPKLTAFSTNAGTAVREGGAESKDAATDTEGDAAAAAGEGEELYNRWATATNEMSGEYSPAAAAVSATSASPYTYGGVAGSFGATGTVGAVMSVEEAERVFAANRKETEGIEKRLNALIKKNRRVLLGGH